MQTSSAAKPYNRCYTDCALSACFRSFATAQGSSSACCEILTDHRPGDHNRIDVQQLDHNSRGRGDKRALQSKVSCRLSPLAQSCSSMLT